MIVSLRNKFFTIECFCFEIKKNIIKAFFCFDIGAIITHTYHTKLSDIYFYLQLDYWNNEQQAIYKEKNTGPSDISPCCAKVALFCAAKQEQSDRDCCIARKRCRRS
jgi:hypothetical protein